MLASFFITISQGIFVRTRFFERRATGGGWGRRWVAAAYVGVGSMLAKFFITISHCAWRQVGSCPWGWVGAGLLLLTLARVLCWLYFLSLLATVRGGKSVHTRGTGWVPGCCCLR
jgi:hypothetical protein